MTRDFIISTFHQILVTSTVHYELFSGWKETKKRMVAISKAVKLPLLLN